MKKILIPILFLLLMTSCKEEEVVPEKRPKYVQSLESYLFQLRTIFFPTAVELPVQIGNTLVIQEEAKSCTSMKYRVGPTQRVGLVMDPNLNIFIGDVIDGNNLYANSEERYRSIGLPRSGGNIKLVIEDSDLTDSIRVEETTKDKVHLAIDSLLNKMIGGSQVKAKIGFEIRDIYSKEQLESYFANHLGNPYLNTFDFTRKNKSRVLVKLYKQYYTTFYDYQDKPSSFFQKEVTTVEMKNELTSGDLSPLYVSGITYGELMILSFEMDMSQKDLSGWVLGAMMYYAENGKVASNFNAVFKDTEAYNNIRIINEPSSSGGYYTNTMYGTDDIAKYLNKPSDFSASKPTTPIRYTLNDIRSNTPYKPVKLGEYVIKECK